MLTALSAHGDSPDEGKVSIHLSGDVSFGEDVAFLNERVETIVLRSDAGTACVAVVPAYQGRVMTSTAGGAEGRSYGWLNYAKIDEGVSADAQINVFGGEERFWLGPEGGQFSIFFEPGAKFEFAEWQTPPLIDTESFDVVESSDTRVSFRKDATLLNYSKSKFELRIDRTIELLSTANVESSLDVEVEGLDFVAYRTTNRVTNTGDTAWTKENGLLSIWLLGMYKHGPETTVVIPYVEGPAEEFGPMVSDDYFGKVPADRLKAIEGVMYFSGDGKLRSKIGVSPQRSKGICGSYDAARGVLTVVKYNQPGSEVVEYVNSMWELQEKPYKGDAINSYNDGPPEPGAKPLGPFYELETSSPALALQPGKSGVHLQETIHVEGSPERLDELAKELFGVGLKQIQSALK